MYINGFIIMRTAETTLMKIQHNEYVEDLFYDLQGGYVFASAHFSVCLFVS